jgi:hypothetical protein
MLGWRPRPESNRRTRICSPLHNHSATRPDVVISFYIPIKDQNGQAYYSLVRLRQGYAGRRCIGLSPEA